MKSSASLDCPHPSNLPHLPPLSLPFSSLEIPQHSSDRPREPLLDAVYVPFFHGNEVLDERHADIGANAGEDVPPTMELKEEAPG